MTVAVAVAVVDMLGVEVAATTAFLATCQSTSVNAWQSLFVPSRWTGGSRALARSSSNDHARFHAVGDHAFQSGLRICSRTECVDTTHEGVHVVLGVADTDGVIGVTASGRSADGSTSELRSQSARKQKHNRRDDLLHKKEESVRWSGPA